MSKSINSIHIRKNSDPVIKINKIEPQFNIKNQTPEFSKVKARFDQIKSARNSRSRKLSNQLTNLQPSYSLRSSSSKFSQKHKNIIMSRTNMLDVNYVLNNHEEKTPKHQNNVVINRYQANLDDHIFRGKLNVPSIQIGNQLKRSGRKLKHQQITDSNYNVRIQKDVQYVQLPQLNLNQLVLKIENNDSKDKQMSKKHSDKDNIDKQKQKKVSIKQQKQKQLIGYWKKENKFVSLTMLQKNERLDFNHPKILPIYAEITINKIRYVVSDQYKNFSLKHLIDQFGPFDENICKRYLKQILQGLQHMHYHKCGHNRLTSRSILYNKDGNIFINAINATSLLLTKKQLESNNQLHYHSPQFLLSKHFQTKSLKNDIWAIGCITLEMFHINIYNSQYHPYNMASFKSQNQQRMIDNLKQICKNYFTQNQQKLHQKKKSKASKIKLSQTAINFIEKCLQIITDRRSTIDQLLEHQFFQ